MGRRSKSGDSILSSKQLPWIEPRQYGARALARGPEEPWVYGADLLKLTVCYIESGEVQSEYRGETAADALNAYARDAGYRDYDELVREFGPVELCIELDIQALCTAVGEKAGVPVFEDSYGTGVALLGDKSYSSYQVLAAAHGLNCWNYKA